MNLLFFLLLNFGQAKEICAQNEYFVKGHSRRAYIRGDGTLVKASQVQPHCKTKSAAYDFWSDKLKDSYPKEWPHKGETLSKWDDDQRERLIGAMEAVPEILWNNSINGIYRFKKSKDFPNPASNGGGMLVLYDNAFENKKGLERILTHELAHTIYQGMERTKSLDYGLKVGSQMRIVGRTIVFEVRIENYVEEDGRSSTEEDFANNVEYFLFEPDKLKKITPEAHDWIEKFFGPNFKLKAKGKK